MPISIAELMSNMPRAFIPESAQGMDAVIQFMFMGEESGEWFAVIKDGKCMVQQGVHPSPTTTLTTDSSEYMTIVTGELNGMQAYMEGQIEVTGDLTLAMNLRRMFT